MQPNQPRISRHSNIAALALIVLLCFLAVVAPRPSSASFIVMTVVGEGRVRASIDQCQLPLCDNKDHKLVPRADAPQLSSSSCALSVGSDPKSNISLFDNSKWNFPHGRYNFETDCCSVHHECYSDCTTSKDQCDSRFFNCAIQSCASQYDVKIPTNSEGQPSSEFLTSAARGTPIDANKLFQDCTRWASCYAAQSVEDGCSIFRALRNQSCECVLADIDDPILALRDQLEKNNYDAIADPIFEDPDDEVLDVDAHHRANVFFGSFSDVGLRAIYHDEDDDLADEDSDELTDNSTPFDLPIPPLSALICPPRDSTTRPTSAANRSIPMKERSSLIFSLALTALILLLA